MQFFSFDDRKAMNIACNEYKSHKTSNKDFSQNSQEGIKATKHLLIYQALKLKI
jgi:hypothetical protein